MLPGFAAGVGAPPHVVESPRNPLAQPRHTRRVGLTLLDACLEGGSEGVVGFGPHRVSSATWRWTVWGELFGGCAQPALRRETALQCLLHHGHNLLGRSDRAHDVDDRAVNRRHRHPEDVPPLPLCDRERGRVDYDAIDRLAAPRSWDRDVNFVGDHVGEVI